MIVTFLKIILTILCLASDRNFMLVRCLVLDDVLSLWIGIIHLVHKQTFPTLCEYQGM